MTDHSALDTVDTVLHINTTVLHKPNSLHSISRVTPRFCLIDEEQSGPFLRQGPDLDDKCLEELRSGGRFSVEHVPSVILTRKSTKIWLLRKIWILVNEYFAKMSQEPVSSSIDNGPWCNYKLVVK